MTTGSSCFVALLPSRMWHSCIVFPPVSGAAASLHCFLLRVVDASSVVDISLGTNALQPLDAYIANDPVMNWPDMTRQVALARHSMTDQL
jgi:hypothetical protein